MGIQCSVVYRNIPPTDILPLWLFSIGATCGFHRVHASTSQICRRRGARSVFCLSNEPLPGRRLTFLGVSDIYLSLSKLSPVNSRKRQKRHLRDRFGVSLLGFLFSTHRIVPYLVCGCHSLDRLLPLPLPLSPLFELSLVGVVSELVSSLSEHCTTPQ